MTDKNANKMWGSRFSQSPAEVMEEINASIGFDKALAPQDIRGSKAHAAMLADAGIITKADAKEIVEGPRPDRCRRSQPALSSSRARSKTCT